VWPATKANGASKNRWADPDTTSVFSKIKALLMIRVILVKFGKAVQAARKRKRPGIRGVIKNN
jgi:hypothetical protein